MIRDALANSVIVFSIIASIGTYGISFWWLCRKFCEIENSYFRGIVIFILCGLYLAIAAFVLSILEVCCG